MKSRVLKIIAGIAVSLVLAGMASSYFLVKILMWVWPGFRDSVYREASRGPYDLHSLIFLSISTLVLLIAVYLFFGVAHYFLKWTGFNQALHRLFQCTSHHALFNALALSVLLACVILNMWVVAIHSVAVYSLGSIDILASEIPTATRLRLRVDFFCMRNADDFYMLHQKLLVLSRAMDVSLPDFELL